LYANHWHPTLFIVPVNVIGVGSKTKVGGGGGDPDKKKFYFLSHEYSEKKKKQEENQ
jgi:hypothetical protein